LAAKILCIVASLEALLPPKLARARTMASNDTSSAQRDLNGSECVSNNSSDLDDSIKTSCDLRPMLSAVSLSFQEMK
jgi:hypothetical protein